MRTDTPKIMRTIPGINNAKPENGFSIIPLHVSAIGHIGIGTDSAMASSVCIETRNEVHLRSGFNRSLAKKLPCLFADSIFGATVHH